MNLPPTRNTIIFAGLNLRRLGFDDPTAPTEPEPEPEPEVTHPSLPNFKDHPPISDVLVYDQHAHEHGHVEIAVVTNVGTHPRLPDSRIVINVEGIGSVCLTIEQSEGLRARLAFAEVDAGRALALSGGGR